jgi:hypothetical protein
MDTMCESNRTCFGTIGGGACYKSTQSGVLLLQHGEGAADWTAAVQASIRRCADRPRSLLVFLNPFGGARQAQAVWDMVARPVMLLAGA